MWGINPVLDLAYSDPLGIKRRTFEPTDPERNAAAMVLDAAAWVLDVVKFPGTAAWSVMTDEQRSKWWTTRLGALNTVAVAFPGIFGVLLNRLPIQDLLAFANQAVVLVAVAREHGVTERDQQVDLLASVLCRRETKSRELLTGRGLRREISRRRRRDLAPVRAHRNVVAHVQDFSCHHGRVAQAAVSGQNPYEIFGKIPVVGVVADYLGERGALVRAAALGEKWIAIRSRNITAVG